MENKPLVSILINCFNSEKFLKETLDSVYGQSYQNFQIILVDNASIDSTAKIAQAYDSRLEYYRIDQNIPLYAARNFGLQFVRGSFLCFLDSDDLWHQDKLKIQLADAESTKADFIYTSQAFFLNSSASKLSLLSKTYLKLLAFSYNHFFSKSVYKTSLIRNYNINMQTVMIRFLAIDGLSFDKNLNLMGDLDFFFRLFWIKNIKIHYNSKTTAYYRIHDTQLSRKSSFKWLKESTAVFRKLKPYFNNEEKKEFNFFFRRYYYSNVLLDQVKIKALTLKLSYAPYKLRHLIHLIKSFAIYFLKRKNSS